MIDIQTKRGVLNDLVDLRAENERLRAERDALRELAGTRKAINRAAEELPEYAEILISVEKGAACVYLHRSRGELSFDVDAYDRLTAEIHAAIDAALRGD